MREMIFIIVCSLSFVSCIEKDYNVDIENTDTVLVVNSIIEANGRFTAHITRSNSIFATENKYTHVLSDANVIVYDENNDTIQLSFIEYDKYVANSAAIAGKNYRIEVTHPKLKKATAYQRVPEVVEIKNIYTNIFKSFHEEAYKSRKIDVEFDDPANTDNYYGLSIIGKRKLYGTIGPYGNRAISFDYSRNDIVEITYNGLYQFVNPINNGFNEVSSEAYEIFFSDALINGKKTTLSLYINEPDSIEKSDTLSVKLYSLSKDYLSYLKSYAAYENRSGLFDEPTRIYNNITNGLGIFGAFSYDSKRLTFSE